MLGLRGAEQAAVTATDGNACEPFPVDGWRIGPAMRADIGVVMPATQGAEAFLEDIWSSKPHLLAKIVTLGEAVKRDGAQRSEEHTSELQSLMRISYAVFCLKKKKQAKETTNITIKHHR